MKEKNAETDKRRKGKIVADIAIISIASLIYAYGLHAFTLPNEIVPGGVTGISTIINQLTNMPVGLLYGLINIPLLILGFIYLGREVMLKTFLCVAIITYATDYLFISLPVYKGDQILAALCGGAFLGGALGFIFRCEGTSGGSDIVSRIIRKRQPHLSLGRIIIALDLLVVGGSILVFGTVDSGLYAVIAIIVSSKMIDFILYGALEGKILLIFSDKYDEIAREIMSKQGRGVTILKGYGGYSKNEKNVICCAVHKNQYAKIKNIVRDSDPTAFIVISNAGEVLGEGFSENTIKF